MVCWQRQDPTTGRRYVAEVIEVGDLDGDTISIYEVYAVDGEGRLTGDGPSVRMRKWLAARGYRHGMRAVD